MLKFEIEYQYKTDIYPISICRVSTFKLGLIVVFIVIVWVRVYQYIWFRLSLLLY